MVTQFIIFLLIFLRMLVAFVTSPIYGNTGVPVIVKVALALIVSYIVFTFVDKGKIEVEITIWFIFTNAVKEILTGAIMGFSIYLVFHAISFAGSLMGYDMGLAMSEVFNPIDETNSNILGEFFHILAIFVFFLINGHHFIIEAVYHSLSVVPIGTFTLNEDVYLEIIKIGASVFILAIKIASPIMVSFFLVHLGEGILARIIPQMQVYFVTYPVKIGLGIFLLIVSLPVYVYVIKNLLSMYEEKLFQLVQLMA